MSIRTKKVSTRYQVWKNYLRNFWMDTAMLKCKIVLRPARPPAPGGKGKQTALFLAASSNVDKERRERRRCFCGGVRHSMQASLCQTHNHTCVLLRSRVQRRSLFSKCFCRSAVFLRRIVERNQLSPEGLWTRAVTAACVHALTGQQKILSI